MYKYCQFFIFLILLFASTIALGQNKAKRLEMQKKKDSTIYHRVPSGDYQLFFKNINIVDEYINESIKVNIKRAEQKEDFKKALFLMEEYVSNFGIKNFFKDTYYIWHLGQLYERYGNMSKAKALYKLVLKHHRGDLKKVQLYYDSLTYLEKDYWVPLDYYYQLVDFRKDIDTLHPPHSVLLNMGPEVNSKDADYGPSMTMEKKVLLFTSRRNKIGIEKKSNEDLFYSVSDDAGYFNPAKAFANINTEFNEGSPCLNRKGDRLYFVRCNAPDGNGNCDIYSADKSTNTNTGEDEWINVKNLGNKINGRAWDSQPSLSHTEDTLFFASDRLGGFGMSDIWFTYKQKDGEWAIPQNLGPIINTRGSEVSPYYHPKFDVLYYSSNGHPLSFGDFDIFKVRRMQGKWEEPRNIGPLVNGKGSEYYFTIDANSKDLYYARSEHDDIQNLDLYSFPLPMEAQPTSYTKLAGKLIDSTTNQPLKGLVSIIDLDNGIEVAPKFLRQDGSFEFDLINNNRYLIIIQGDDFFSLEEELNIKNDTLIRFMTKIIDIKKPLVLDRIEFENGKAEILDGMKNSLDLILKFLLDNPSFKLTISGHTDSDGNHADNMLLSQKRAEAIRDYFILKGKIDLKRIQAMGYGDTKPLRVEITPEDKRINRRVEFEVKRPSD